MKRLRNYIRFENGTKDSCDDQIRLAGWLLENEITESQNRVITGSEIEERLSLEYRVKTSLENLEEIEVVKKNTSGGGRSFVLHERSETFVYGRKPQKIESLLQRDLPPFLENLSDNETKERVVASALDVGRDEIDAHILAPTDPYDQAERYDEGVVALEESDKVDPGEGYGRLTRKSEANRWSLSEFAEALGKNQGLPVDGEDVPPSP